MTLTNTFNAQKAGQISRILGIIICIAIPVVLVIATFFRDVLPISSVWLMWGLGLAGWALSLALLRSSHDLDRARDQALAISQALTQVENLNLTLRQQRHDFFNHLQVIYGLLDLGDIDDARGYLEHVSADLRRISRVMRTSMPAVNALLQAKSDACEDRGVVFECSISTSLEGLPMEQWEACRVLANLLDNAMDAAGQLESGGRVHIILDEDDAGFSFIVTNNGSPIPTEHLGRIFERGFTTKPTGQGLGLAIIKDTLADCGGSVHVESNPLETRFLCRIPKKPTPNS
nr:Spo0B domain-containing protein [bacterium]